ncbi:MAG: tail fiber domain-containing protein [Opitutales bacterium]|nr:tail fiber domain-containing protein [Opitutales bacterium]
MKTKFLQYATLLAVASVLAVSQTSAVPDLMSYQGRVTDAGGTLIGNTTPVNRAVTFRLYTEATGGDVIYAETQTVTISGGEFSVLIGNGTGVSGTPGPSAPAPIPFSTLSQVINSATGEFLYLGITVDDSNSATVSAEIAPRQQLVSGAYALRAGVAEAVANGAVTEAMLGDSSVATGNIQAKAIDSSRIADGGVSTTNIANNAITINKLDTGQIGVWTPNGNNVYRSGNVGIGQSNPGFPLNFANTTGNKIALWGNSGNHYGLGIQSGLLQIYTGASSADVAFGYGHSGSMTETMRIKGNGNVGIGTSAPTQRLHVNGGSAIIQNNSNPYLRVTSGGQVYADLGLAGSNGSFSNSSSANDTVLRASNQLHLQSGTAAAALTINSANNVSVAKSLSAAALSVSSNASVGNNLSVAQNVTVSGNLSAADLSVRNVSARDTRVRTLHVNERFSGSYPQGLYLEWNKNNGTGSSYLLNRRGGGGGGIVFGEVESNGSYTENATVQSNGDLRIRGNYGRYSDARLKQNIEDAEPMIDRLMQVQFRRYNRIDRDDPTKEFGVIAQELQTIFPELILDGMDDILAVNYGTLATITSKALQELKVSTDSEIDGLKSEIAEKNSTIADLEARLAALEELVRSSR